MVFFGTEQCNAIRPTTSTSCVGIFASVGVCGQFLHFSRQRIRGNKRTKSGRRLLINLAQVTPASPLTCLYPNFQIRVYMIVVPFFGDFLSSSRATKRLRSACVPCAPRLATRRRWSSRSPSRIATAHFPNILRQQHAHHLLTHIYQEDEAPSRRRCPHGWCLRQARHHPHQQGQG